MDARAFPGTDLANFPQQDFRARVSGSPSWHIQKRSDRGRSPTVWRLRAVVRITY